MTGALEQLLDLMTRAEEAMNSAPVLYANQEIVDRWVLVPREHLRTIESWHGEIDEDRAIGMITEILADVRLIGLKDTPTPP